MGDLRAQEGERHREGGDRDDQGPHLEGNGDSCFGGATALGADPGGPARRSSPAVLRIVWNDANDAGAELGPSKDNRVRPRLRCACPKSATEQSDARVAAKPAPPSASRTNAADGHRGPSGLARTRAAGSRARGLCSSSGTSPSCWRLRRSGPSSSSCSCDKPRSAPLAIRIRPSTTVADVYA